jgi:uncharacterized membrane protein
MTVTSHKRVDRSAKYLRWVIAAFLLFAVVPANLARQQANLPSLAGELDD